MKYLIVLLLIVTNVVSCKGDKAPSIIYNRQVLEKYLVTPDEFYPIPIAKNSFWERTLPFEFRQDYVNLGYTYHNAQWVIIPNSVFREYRTTGNRANYEKMSFTARRQMACLVMGEIMEHKGELIDDVLRGLDYFINETWWGISAHYPTTQPERDNQVVDIFNSETANMLAWTTYMLHDELEKNRPGICEQIRKEIERRILVPARQNNYDWKKKIDNHNTWVCANWLSCILLCEKDRNQQIDDIGQVLACLDIFYNGYPKDGGCDEGVHYWDRAAASLFECIRLLDVALNNKVSMANNEKFIAMGSFVYKSYIGDRASVNFADTPSTPQVNINILYPYGHYIGDTYMMEYAAYLAKSADFRNKPTTLFKKSGNYPTLSRELFFLTEYDLFDKCPSKAPLIRDTWLNDLQVMTARSYNQSEKGLFLAAKGGNNAERHNHNDVGSFIVYYDNEPLLIDIGVAVYNSQTFGKNRYDIMNCRSAFHNVPLINGVEQHEGKDFCAFSVNYKERNNRVTFSYNLEKAYPKEARINYWRRKVVLDRGKSIEVSEFFKLSEYLQPTELIFLSREKPEIQKPGIIVVNLSTGSHYIMYNANQLSAIIEEIPIDDAGIISSWNTTTLYRIRLVVRNHKLKGTIKYTIQ